MTEHAPGPSGAPLVQVSVPSPESNGIACADKEAAANAAASTRVLNTNMRSIGLVCGLFAAQGPRQTGLQPIRSKERAIDGKFKNYTIITMYYMGFLERE